MVMRGVDKEDRAAAARPRWPSPWIAARGYSETNADALARYDTRRPACGRGRHLTRKLFMPVAVVSLSKCTARVASQGNEAIKTPITVIATPPPHPRETAPRWRDGLRQRSPRRYHLDRPP